MAIKSIKNYAETIDAAVAERFWSRVALTADDEKCWLWQRRKNIGGYGMFDLQKRVVFVAHRFAWFLTYGTEPDTGKFLLHSCDTPACVNPRHLREGSHEENVSDMLTRKRQAFGERNKGMKLREDAVLRLREMAAAGMSSRLLAETFGISKAQAHRIATGRNWKHL